MESLADIFAHRLDDLGSDNCAAPGDSLGQAPIPAADPIERRLQTRAYRYWLTQIEGDEIPAVEDLRPGELEEFGPVGVLVDLTLGASHPAIVYLGERLATECGVSANIFLLDEVPRYSLLSNLTEHCLEVVARRAPLGYDADLAIPGELPILYRSILLPYSSNGATVDFVFGVMSWKRQEPVAPRSPPANFAKAC